MSIRKQQQLVEEEKKDEWIDAGHIFRIPGCVARADSMYDVYRFKPENENPWLMVPFSKCCKARLEEWPIILFDPSVPADPGDYRAFVRGRETVVGYLYHCRSCLGAVPFQPGGARARIINFKNEFSRSLIDDIIKSKLKSILATGPGIAYWLIRNSSGKLIIYQEDTKSAVSGIPVDMAANAYQPGDDFMDQEF